MAQITDRLDSRHRQAQPGESNECEKKKKKKEKKKVRISRNKLCCTVHNVSFRVEVAQNRPRR